MGLSFYYKGKLKTPQSLKKMTEEVTDICKANKWEFAVFDDTFPNNTFTIEPNKDKVYGIFFTPPKCETVNLTFLSNGRLCAAYNLELNKNLKYLEDDIYLYSLSVKTQYCGLGIHNLLIPIFDYLNKNYFEEFEFTDEGHFWETRDEKLLEETFARYSNLINSFGSALEHIPFLEGESIEDYVERMAEIIKNNNNE
ncbi:MAG TPA: hypothetical protein VN182_05765 [Flavobacterium sp.]|nr:hypothetical protein [Flavobacterium sp.]